MAASVQGSKDPRPSAGNPASPGGWQDKNSQDDATGQATSQPTEENGANIGVEAASSPTSPQEDEPKVYITGWRLGLVIFTVFMSTLLAALEIGIIATAIPGITDDFHRLDDVGWYGSATFLLAGATAPMWGKLYKFLVVKYVYVASVALYLLGSLVAALAPDSPAVVVGRAFQGWGAAGTFAGSILAIHYVAHPRRHPVLIGSWMALFMVSTILGPVVGGALTSGVSWRWCFWINLPLGGPIIVLLLLFVRMPKHVKPTPATWTEIIRQLDLPGFFVLLASLICFTLALQYGGLTRPWHDGAVVATFVLWVVLSIAFVAVEWWQRDRAMVPLRLLKPRLTWANILFSLFCNACMYLFLFYLPIYFQSIHGKSAIISGVNLLPLLALFAVGSMLSGVGVGKTRRLQPFQFVSALLMTAGAALLYKLEIDSSQAWFMGSEALLGFGIGLGYQVAMTTIQGFSTPEDVGPSSGIVLMVQAGSGAYFIAVAQSIFTNRMIQTLGHIAPQIDTATAIATGASEIRHVFHGAELDAVLRAYMVGIQDVFAAAVAGAAVTVLMCLAIPLRKLPDHGPSKPKDAEEVEDLGKAKAKR